MGIARYHTKSSFLTLASAGPYSTPSTSNIKPPRRPHHHACIAHGVPVRQLIFSRHCRSRTHVPTNEATAIVLYRTVDRTHVESIDGVRCLASWTDVVGDICMAPWSVTTSPSTPQHD